MTHIAILEQLDFEDIVISIKSTDVPKTIEAYRLMSKKSTYPLHIGITESGTPSTGIIKSSVGIGALLAEGIGDTLRVSLTGNPVEEIRVGLGILKSLNLYSKGINLISCPTCGRLGYNMEKIVKEIEEKTRHIEKPINVAIMGCVVNGPGEAKEADIGLCGGDGQGMIFKKGILLKKVKEDEMVNELIKEINSLVIEN